VSNPIHLCSRNGVRSGRSEVATDEVQKYAVLVGVNKPKESCHGVRKARADGVAYAECIESRMMAMFG
jgi:hypothetical protein